MNFKVTWCDEDQAWVGTVDEYPSLSWIDKDSSKAMDGIVELAYVTRDDIAKSRS